MAQMILLLLLLLFNDIILAVTFFNVLLLSYSSHEMSAQVVEDGTSQRLPVDGGRVHQEPGTTQASRRETGGLLSVSRSFVA